MENNVQLKREEIVGENVVLSDINPTTDTDSVLDPTTNVTLTQTLDRVWSAINNKLSRVVNSVNGRTGVVVLNANDVGLGKVDNVSFQDIKTWVIDEMTREFRDKRLKLYASLDELDIELAKNDKILQDSPFYASSGKLETNDKRSYIGFITWDNVTSKLVAEYRAINTIGFTDDSLLYNEKAHGVDNRYGGLSVNIHKDEEALELVSEPSDDITEPKKNSGLRINRDKLVPEMTIYEGIYGNISDPGGDASLIYKTPPTGTDVPKIRIFYNDTELASDTALYSKKSFKLHDKIICKFVTYIGNDNTIPLGLHKDLMGLNAAIGEITKVNQDPVSKKHLSYELKFYDITPEVGYGLQYGKSHGKNELTQMQVRYLRGNVNPSAEQYSTESQKHNFRVMANVSGLNAYPNGNERDPENYGDRANMNLNRKSRKTVVMPIGPIEVIQDSPDFNNSGGLSISPDSSLCVMPTYAFTLRNFDSSEKREGCMLVENWSPASPWRNVNYETSKTYEDDSMLGINLVKAVQNTTGERAVSRYKLSNLSGLKVISPASSDDWSVSELLNYSGSVTDPDIPDSRLTGGLMINCGKFLQIEPGKYEEHYQDFDNSGKLTIKIGAGLGDDGTGKLALNISEEGGIIFDKTNNSLSVGLTEKGGLGIDTKTEDGKTTSTIGIKLFDTTPDVLKETGLYVNDEGLLSIKTESTVDGIRLRGGLGFDQFGNHLRVNMGLYSKTGISLVDGLISCNLRTIKFKGKTQITNDDGSVRTEPITYEYSPVAEEKYDRIIEFGKGFKITLDEDEKAIINKPSPDDEEP